MDKSLRLIATDSVITAEKDYSAVDKDNIEYVDKITEKLKDPDQALKNAIENEDSELVEYLLEKDNKKMGDALTYSMSNGKFNSFLKVTKELSKHNDISELLKQNNGFKIEKNTFSNKNMNNFLTDMTEHLKKNDGEEWMIDMSSTIANAFDISKDSNQNRDYTKIFSALGDTFEKCPKDVRDIMGHFIGKLTQQIDAPSDLTDLLQLQIPQPSELTPTMSELSTNIAELFTPPTPTPTPPQIPSIGEFVTQTSNSLFCPTCFNWTTSELSKCSICDTEVSDLQLHVGEPIPNPDTEITEDNNGCYCSFCTGARSTKIDNCACDACQSKN